MRTKLQQTLVDLASNVPRAQNALAETTDVMDKVQSGMTGSATASRGLATSGIDSA